MLQLDIDIFSLLFLQKAEQKDIMAGFNRVILIGNLTRDPEYKQLSSGMAVCRLGLATNRSFKNKQSGDMVQEVCYIDIDVWGAQAESCRQYLQKGRLVLIEGRLKLDTWQDENGNSRSKHSVVADKVVFLSSNEAEAGQQSAPNKLEKDVFDKIDAVKAKNQENNFKAVEKKVSTPIKPAVAEPRKEPRFEQDDYSDMPEFKDEPPFQ